MNAGSKPILKASESWSYGAQIYEYRSEFCNKNKTQTTYICRSTCAANDTVGAASVQLTSFTCLAMWHQQKLNMRTLRKPRGDLRIQYPTFHLAPCPPVAQRGVIVLEDTFVLIKRRFYSFFKCRQQGQCTAELNRRSFFKSIASLPESSCSLHLPVLLRETMNKYVVVVSSRRVRLSDSRFILSCQHAVRIFLPAELLQQRAAAVATRRDGPTLQGDMCFFGSGWRRGSRGITSRGCNRFV